MLNRVNFEHAYAAVMESENYSDNEKKAFTQAVRSSFHNMHQNILDKARHIGDGLWNVIDPVIDLFRGDQNECGLFFTLNQDLFMEDGFGNSTISSSDFEILGIEKKAWFLDSVVDDIESNPILLPSRDDVEKIKSNLPTNNSEPFLYLKLHGSYGWRKKDGLDAMVIGDSKTKAIADEPLLSLYHELFRETLLKDDQKLVVIGYSFGDAHINGAIADGIRKSRLRLQVVNPAGVDAFKDLLMRRPIEREGKLTYDSIIWQGLGGYHQGTVCDFYDSLPKLTHEGETFLGSCGLI